MLVADRTKRKRELNGSLVVGAVAGALLEFLIVPLPLIAGLLLSGQFSKGHLIIALPAGLVLFGGLGAWVGAMGGLVRRFGFGAALGAGVFALFFAIPFGHMATAEPSVGVLCGYLLLVASGSLSGAFGAAAARALVEVSDSPRSLQFTLGDAFVLTFLVALLVGCHVHVWSYLAVP